VRHLLAIIGILAAFTAFPTLADVTGAARIVDGDTIWIGETKIRLYGIDAPEAKQLTRTATATPRRYSCSLCTKLESVKSWSRRAWMLMYPETRCARLSRRFPLSKMGLSGHSFDSAIQGSASVMFSRVMNRFRKRMI